MTTDLTTFDTTFTHQMADVNGVRLHYVIGGQGDPVVLLSGWPNTWYQWRRVMPALAERYTVIAVDMRGLGDSSKPTSGYRKKNVAKDVYQLVRQLGFQRIFLVGIDMGVAVTYAYTADHREDVRRLVQIEGTVPGFGFEQLMTFSPETSREGGIWHIPFHMVPDLSEALIAGREKAYLTYFFTRFAYDTTAVTEAEIDEYVRTFASPGGIRGTCEYYRTIFEDVEDNKESAKVKLQMPVLALGGKYGLGKRPLHSMQAVAEDVRGDLHEYCGHYMPEERPEYVIEQLLNFFGEESRS
ncbi:putative hydrolase (plasmid) [Scytonema sp. HK-05]|uniref:alpha/beta fold hydrolase n=1 Tax=Scytonema sp. HK-05 TaxID=1137095 RepID=UPI0009375406|nr:alpha/beta hydrolase [Scytonema sp. HK-05]OKH42711.1 alpha/beta hydrolase [Scytonema sp. HK-05]BAY50070.1 putative hydrolase [Scytonema sp. HK-05]